MSAVQCNGSTGSHSNVVHTIKLGHGTKAQKITIYSFEPLEATPIKKQQTVVHGKDKLQAMHTCKIHG